MRAAIVEDDADLAENLRIGLGAHGIEAVAVTEFDGPVVLEAARDVDVVVLDVMLRGHDGVELCRQLRRAGMETAVLMLTARGRVADRVRGLEAGADDYLVKPFALEELVARIGALVRRRAPLRSSAIDVGGLTFDTASGTASVGARLLKLTERETALLQYLLANAGRVVPQRSIYEQLWTFGAPPSSNLVEVYVGRLRRKLSDAGAGLSIITLKQQGYRLEPAGGTAAHEPAER